MVLPKMYSREEEKIAYVEEVTVIYIVAPPQLYINFLNI